MLSHPRIPAWRTPQPRACATALRSAVAPPRQCLTILEVFQLPASITQVVDAPGAGGLGLGREPKPDHLRRERHHAVTRLRTRCGP